MAADQSVIIYSTQSCAFCRTLKQYLESKNVDFVVKDIEESTDAETELLEKVGGVFQGVPTTDMAGEIVVGFDRKKIDAIIAEKQLGS